MAVFQATLQKNRRCLQSRVSLSASPEGSGAWDRWRSSGGLAGLYAGTTAGPLVSTFNPPVRPICYLKRGCEIILLFAGRQQREIPPFVLKKARNRYVVAKTPLPFEK